MRSLASSVNARRLGQVAVDACLFSLAYYLAYVLRFDEGITPRYDRLLGDTLFLVVAIQLAVFALFGLYSKLWRFVDQRDFQTILKAMVVSTAALLAVLYLFSIGRVDPPRSVIALDFTADDNPLIAMPLYHSAGMHVFMLPYLSVGATVRLMATPDIPEILRRVEADRIGSLFLAPTVWVPLAGHPDLATRDLSSLRKAQYGASIMPVTVLNRLREQFPGMQFYNCFGQSEIGPLATVLRPEEHEDRPSSCGRPVFFVETRVVDSDGNDVEPGVPGEILYRSPQLCRGYWENPAATEDAFRDGWFHSGDLVTRDAEGFITVVDRIKDVINTGGILVASREVEDAIYTHEAVSEVAVIGEPDEKWIEAITAVVVVRDGRSVTEQELIEHVRSRIAPFKVPKKVRFVDELPRNQSGKLLKRELRSR